MKLCITVLLLCICNLAYGKKAKKEDVPITACPIDLRYNSVMSREDTATSGSKILLRFKTARQTVNIWSNDGIVFHGTLTDHTFLKPPRRGNAQTASSTIYYTRKTEVDTTTARRIYNLIIQDSLLQIPSSSGSNQTTLDGEQESIEYVHDSNRFYYHQKQKNYSADMHQARLYTFTKHVESMLNMHSCWIRFLHCLPKGCYYYGGLVYRCNSLTRR